MIKGRTYLLTYLLTYLQTGAPVTSWRVYTRPPTLFCLRITIPLTDFADFCLRNEILFTMNKTSSNTPQMSSTLTFLTLTKLLLSLQLQL